MGASKHGVSRTDYHILNDPTLAFLEAHQRFTSQRGAGVAMSAQGEITKAGMGAAENPSAPLLTPAELASAAAAAKVDVNVAKEEEGEGKEVKAEEGEAEVAVKMETEGGYANDIPCTKTETPDEQKENEGEVREDEVKKEEQVKKEEVAQPQVEKEEQSGEGEKTPKAADDKDLTEERKSLTLGGQKEMTAELPEHPESSPKAQADRKTAEEEDREERENPESPKSPKSADTEKSPEEEEEERMDEDDKSEKSSQAEGTGRVYSVIAWR